MAVFQQVISSWQPAAIILVIYYTSAWHLAGGAEAVSPVKISPLFVPSPRYPCFRQPVLIPAEVNASTTVLLAFAENRNVTACAPSVQDSSGLFDTPVPNEIGSLHMRRSTDGGLTFGKMQTIFVGDIDFYSGVFDGQTGRTWLFLEAVTEVKIFFSDDLGKTWSKPITLGSTPPTPFSPVTKPTVGHGIQLTGSYRLVVPFICTNTSASGGGGGDKGSCAQCQSCLLVSDDSGLSWQFTQAFGQSGSRESQVVETSPGHLFASERNFGPTPGHRMWAKSSNSGNTFASYGINMNLVTPVTSHWTGIVGALASINRGQKIAFASAASSDTRANLTLKVSQDGGDEWSTALTVWSGPSGYVDMVPVGNATGKLALLFECGTSTFADYIGFSLIQL